MYLNDVTVSDIIECIDNRDFRKIRQVVCDTLETVLLLQTSKNIHFSSLSEIFDWLKNNMGMRDSSNNSLYRAYLCSKTKEIFNLRITNHYATNKGTKKSWKHFGTPEIEFHLIIEKIALTQTKKTPIESDKKIQTIPIIIKECSLNDFMNNSKRDVVFEEIIDILKNGSSNNPKIQKLTESYYRKYNIVEYDVDNLFEKQILKTYISECVKETLLEEGLISRVKNAWNAFWNDSSQQTQPNTQYTRYNRNVSQQPVQGNQGQTTNTVQQPAQTQTPTQGNQSQTTNTAQQPARIRLQVNLLSD